MYSSTFRTPVIVVIAAIRPVSSWGTEKADEHLQVHVVSEDICFLNIVVLSCTDFRHVVKTEGIRALYKGLIPNLVGVAPSK